eukprot:UN15450
MNSKISFDFEKLVLSTIVYLNIARQNYSTGIFRCKINFKNEIPNIIFLTLSKTFLMCPSWFKLVPNHYD